MTSKDALGCYADMMWDHDFYHVISLDPNHSIGRRAHAQRLAAATWRAADAYRDLYESLVKLENGR